jgi:hypothetical protein
MVRNEEILDASQTGMVLNSQNALSDLIGAAFGCRGVLLDETCLSPAFFDLRTGLAGELFQKLTNYQLQTAVVVAQPELHGARIVELVNEHRQHPQIRFFAHRDPALAWLSEE